MSDGEFKHGIREFDWTEVDRLLSQPLEEIEQAWRRHLASEREWKCPKHGYVNPVNRIHGGRGRGFECPTPDCSHTLTNTDVDWDAYHEARENDEEPPCPRCGSLEIDTVPAKPSLICTECTHQFGYAGGYY